MIREDDLQYKGLKLLQNSDEYCFTSDAVLLSSFVRAKSSDTVVDFGAGNGVICILVSAKTNCAKVVGIESQTSAAELARQNVTLNNLVGKVEIVNDDIARACDIVGKESVEVVVCNPPYFAKQSGMTRLTPSVALARHEGSCDLRQIIEMAASILKFGGKMFMIHKSERLAEALTHLSNNNLQPKKLTFIYPKQSKGADTFVVEAKKGAKPGLQIESLVVYDDNGEYTREAKILYNIND
ncbi:MAG: tRNA1(Val) (adenine(37)-N6)-methyltransferase [Clostridia bacterium]